MGFKLYSEEDFVCDVASISGYSDLIDFVNRFSGKNQIKKLLKEGKSDDPAGVKSDVDELLPYVTSLSLRSILENLRLGLSKVKEIAIISE